MLIGLLLGGAAGGGGSGCVHTADATAFAFRYQFHAYRCDTTCATPSDSAIASAARGDTIWLRHMIDLIGAVDSVTPQFATLRPDCEENVAVLSGANTLRHVPAPSCPDSTYQQGFQLAGIDYPQIIVLYTRWVVDSGLTPGRYQIRGRVMTRPRLEPTFQFDIQ